MQQIARNLTDIDSGALRDQKIYCMTEIPNSVQDSGLSCGTEAWFR